MKELLVEKDGYISNRIYNYLTESKLIKESKVFPKKQLEESENGGYIIYALLQKSDVENRNGRIYPHKLLVREVEKYQEQIKLGCSIGEVTHPDSSEVNPNNSPFRILETYWKDNVLYGKLEIMVSKPFRESGIVCTVADDIALKLQYGVTLGVSSRGVGSLEKENGKNIVQDDFELICWDIVHAPSTYNAYMFSKEEEPKIQKMEQELPRIIKKESSSKIDNFLKIVNF